jgi:subtilase family serine protease
MLILLTLSGCVVEDEGESDLIISDMFLEYQDLDQNGVLSVEDEIDLIVKIKNIGDDKSEDSHLLIELYRKEYDGSVFLDDSNRSTPELYPDDVEYYTIAIDVSEVGNYIISCHADHEHEAEEIDDRNNERELEFYVGSSSGGSGSGDLIIVNSLLSYTDIDHDQKLSVGDHISLTVLVKNIGNQSVGQSTLSTALYRNGVFKNRITHSTPPLNPNNSESFDIAISSNYGSGDYQIESQADYYHAIYETDESNNQDSMTFYVHP